MESQGRSTVSASATVGTQGRGGHRGRGGRRGRGRGRNLCNHPRNCNSCREEISTLRYQVMRRGSTIRAMHFALTMLLENAHALPSMTVDVPLGAYAARGEQLQDHINNIVQQVQSLATPPQPFVFPHDFNCNICYEQYDSAEHLPLIIQCGHFICLQCIRNMRVMECHYCRQRISSVTRIYT